MPLILLGLFFRIINAFYNGFVGPSIGAEFDAISFHNAATEYQNILMLEEGYKETYSVTDQATTTYGELFNIGWIYSYWLAWIYYVLTDSIFIGCLFSCLAWLFSAIFLHKIFKLLGFNKYNQNLALLIYVLLPSSIMFTSVTLREVYQLLFMNLSIYLSLAILIKSKIHYWIILPLSMFVLSITHLVFIVISIFVLFITFIFFTKLSKSKSIDLLVIILIQIPIGIFFIYSSINWFQEYTDKDFSEIWTIVETLQGYHWDLQRSDYIQSPQINSLADLIYFYPISLFKYFFEPMPWRIGTTWDLFLFVENTLRGLFIIMAFYKLFTFKGENLGAFLFLLFSFFLIESMWALGTVNWGTAVRHHIPSWGLLLIISFYPVKKTSPILKVKTI